MLLGRRSTDGTGSGCCGTGTATLGGLFSAVALLVWLLAAPAAFATTADIIAPSDPDNPQAESGWQAGTCNFDSPTCSVESPSAQFFEKAGGHPKVGFTQFIVASEPGAVGEEEPIGDLKTVRVDLPAGIAVNPQATPQCKQEDFEKTPTPQCPAGSEVGTSFVTGSLLGVPAAVPISATVYNIEPPEGEPARFGFNLAGNDIYLQAGVEWTSDYHEYFTIHVPELPLGLEGLILKNRLVFDGTSGAGNETFITTPTTCLGEATSASPFRNLYSTWLLASSFEEEAEPGYEFPNSARPPLESRIPPGTSPKDCDSVPFEPSIEVDPNTGLTDSPSGAAVTVKLPEVKGGANQSSSQVRSATVTLPAGMGLNPSAANGLQACTDAQFGKGTRNPVACPPASRVGTVDVDTPPLPDGSLTGPVYVGRQLSRDPTSGEEYRIFTDIESPRYGISARLLGKVSANPQTGRLTTTFDDGPLGSVSLPGLPQVPFTSIRVTFNGGSGAPLTSPPTCGPNTTTTRMVPWSSAVGIVPPGGEEGPSTDPPATDTDNFALASLPGGGKCPKTLAERPFGPDFGAGTDTPQAGAYSPLSTTIARPPGEQELKGVDVHLPPGLTAKLAGVSYCPEEALAAAAASSGIAEAANSSCPASSLIGSASVLAGSGPAPLHIDGKVFLAGPYHGAPLSLAVVTPATAGPFDLGSVVVRVALFVDRETARVTAVSDPIPHVYGGALLDVRSIAVRLDRPGFALNPTNCSPLAIGGTLRGGGANPADPGAFSAVDVSTPFQVSGCEQLSFEPKLFLRLFGAMRRATNPKLRAVYVARAGDANTARAAVTLPRTLFLDQSNISRVCTRAQYAAHACPKNSIYGYARAFTPLLDEPLEGPVYLRSSDNPLPDLVASLHGQVSVDLVGRIDSIHGRIRTTYDTVPDVPVSAFVLTMRGGGRGLLTNSRDQCPRRSRSAKRKGGGRSAAQSSRKGRGKRRNRRPLRAVARIAGQNGKKANQRPKVRRACRGSHHRRHRRHHRRRG
jgi:hypothetical protein